MLLLLLLSCHIPNMSPLNSTHFQRENNFFLGGGGGILSKFSKVSKFVTDFWIRKFQFLQIISVPDSLAKCCIKIKSFFIELIIEQNLQEIEKDKDRESKKERVGENKSKDER